MKNTKNLQNTPENLENSHVYKPPTMSENSSTMSEKSENIGNVFEILGLVLEVKMFSNIYSIYQNDPEWAEIQVKSVADAWHNGNIRSAAIAFESDLKHL